MRKKRKHYTGEEKVAILRRHLLEKVPVSDLCEELELQPTVILPLAKRVLRERRCGLPVKDPSRTQRRAEANRVSGEDSDQGRGVAELMAEHIALKKSRGEL
jgi:transposase